MCGRFTQSFTWTELVELYRLTGAAAPSLAASFNVAPLQMAAAVVAHENGFCLQPVRWGLLPSWAKDQTLGPKLINARAETLAEKPAFRQALRLRRCVVPVSGFYEWRGHGREKQPYYVSGLDGWPLSLAGLWERWQDILTFTIITVPANEKLSPIHERMPAILSPQEALLWLEAPDVSLLRPFASQTLALWPVSNRVNFPRNNDPGLIERIEAGEPTQRQNDQFQLPL
ncbi:MAG: SOS response-associated peptidase [Rhodomicrobium sp.]